MPENDAASPQTTPPKPMDRAEAAGLPPDSGPEVEVIRVRPSLWRGHPFGATLLLVVPIVGLIALPIAGFFALPLSFAVAGAFALVCWFMLFIWWLRFSVAQSLWISNKRVVERRGLLSRSLNEVLHDHVRNIQVKQSFIQRVFGIGSVGISSAGQDGIEIFMKNLPNPDDIKRTIDLYRPL